MGHSASTTMASTFPTATTTTFTSNLSAHLAHQAHQTFYPCPYHQCKDPLTKHGQFTTYVVMNDIYPSPTLQPQPWKRKKQHKKSKKIK